jgi:hypothetical protein
LADSDTGYVHSIIPYYGKITGEGCNLPYPDKPFTRRTVHSLMDRLGHSIYGIKCRYAFTDLNCSSVDLAEEVDKRECHATSTIIARRVGNPKPVTEGALKRMKW